MDGFIRATTESPSTGDDSISGISEISVSEDDSVYTGVSDMFQ